MYDEINNFDVVENVQDIDFQSIKERIESGRMRNDLSEAFRRTGLTHPVYHNAMKKDSITELGIEHIKILNVLIDIQNERAEGINELINKLQPC